MTALVLGALIAVVAVVRRAAVPPRTPASRDADRRPERRASSLLELIEERDRALAALKELEFDHRTGRSTTPTTAPSSGRCAAAAAEALQALDAGTTRQE